MLNAAPASGSLASNSTTIAVRTSASAGFVTRYPLAAGLLATQGLLLLLTAPWYGVLDLRLAWTSATPLAVAYAALVAGWIHVRRYAGHPTKHILPEVILATGVLLTLTNIVSPAQYLAVAVGRPLIDGWLAHADASIGVHVPALVLWTAAHPRIALLLEICYASLLPQFLVPIAVVGLACGDRRRMWEYVFHFHFCLIATLAALLLFPAEHAFTYFGFQPTIDQSLLAEHFAALRRGTFHVIRFQDVQGLISMPSFHAAGALMVTWACGRRWSLTVPVAIVNVGLIAATFMSGVHYVVDVLASIVLFATSVAVYRRGVARWCVPAGR